MSSLAYWLPRCSTIFSFILFYSVSLGPCFSDILNLHLICQLGVPVTGVKHGLFRKRKKDSKDRRVKRIQGR